MKEVNELPFVSIIVAAHNAEKTIRRCIESLLQLDYPNYEVIVVDNNSTDNTANIVKSYPVVYLFESKRGWPAARNTGIRYSKAEIVSNIDSDCFVDRSYLKNLVKVLLSDPSIGGVGAKLKVEAGKTLAEQYYAYSDPFNIEKRIENRLNDPLVPWGGAPNAYKKKAFEETGYYDSDKYISGADIEFHYRMQTKTNYKMKYVPTALVYHVPRGSIKELFKVAAKYTNNGFLRAVNNFPNLREKYSWFTVKKLTNVVLNILGFGYRLLKFLLNKETKLRVVEPLFSNLQLLGSLYGYFTAKFLRKQLN